MHEHHSPHHEIAGILSATLRSFQQRRELRRMRMADIYAATSSMTPPASVHPQGASKPPPGADAGAAFHAMGIVDTGGHAVPVINKEEAARLQALHDQARAAAGIHPSELFAVFSGMPPERANPSVSPAATGAAANMPPPPVAPKTANQAPPAETAKTANQAAASIPTSPDTGSKEEQPSTTNAAPKEERPHEQPAAGDSREPILAHLDAILSRRAEEDAARLTALLREHESRLAQQGEVAAKQQATLLREVMDGHAKQLDAQAARHTQVIRDLLREHQNQLDEHATAAAAREAQVVGSLLREHRDALKESRDAHRRDLEEILEHHRGELGAARKAPTCDSATTQLRELLTEQAKNQHAAHTRAMTEISALTDSVENIGEAVAKLAATCTQQHEDIFSLPPPSFVPPLPDIPTVIPPPIVSPTKAATACSPTRPPATSDASNFAARTAPSLPKTARHVDEDHEREHVHEVLDETEDDVDDVDDVDDELIDDEARPRLAPLTPIENEEHAHA